jgi:hypothetical protein
VDLIPDSLLPRKSGSGWYRARISGSVARNSDRYTTEVVQINNIAKLFNWAYTVTEFNRKNLLEYILLSFHILFGIMLPKKECS